MSDRLDHLVARLAAAPTDRPLDRFDAELAQGIARRRDEARAASSLGPVRLASLGLALAMGVAAGGVAAKSSISAPEQFNSFDLHPELAPSTLLERGR